MPEVPECLSRRYRALDDLVQELSAMSTHEYREDSLVEKDPEIKLMCNFWNILKEDPDCNLTQAVKYRMGLQKKSSVFHPRQFACFMAKEGVSSDNKCLKSGCVSESCAVDHCPHAGVPESVSSQSRGMPLAKVLCNLKEAMSFDKKCNEKISCLMATQKELQMQIEALEQREAEGVTLMKEADAMWLCMENCYKTKLVESLERRKGLMDQLKEVKTSHAKWTKNKKELDLQIKTVDKVQQEINDKINMKKNDIKFVNLEIQDFKKRIENSKVEIEGAKKSLTSKRDASDLKIAKIAKEVTNLTKKLKDETRCQKEKEGEGTQYIQEARDELQKICKVLLRKKLENEDLRAEKNALEEEIELLKQTCEQCKNKCTNQQKDMMEEIKRIDKEIAEYKVKCIRCHQCTDTADVRKLCNDCPRCKEERECLIEGDHCEKDLTMDCVCMTVKEKFLDNVFENMYTVLERKARTGPGKAVADAILKCLKNSRNGKLNRETRQLVQDFILNGVKRNLNLTIIGGAVKTRCELDPETYDQLMLCLKQINATKPPKADKGTTARKEPCRRWGGPNECNCPKGPKSCVCTKKAPAPLYKDSALRPFVDEDEEPTDKIECPYKESLACGPDCGMRDPLPNAVDTEIASWRPDPCSGSGCPFTKNMRAAQCVLGPDSLSSLPKSITSTMPHIPNVDNDITCGCKNTKKPCNCKKDLRSRPREMLIEEVMGKYVEVRPIDKVKKIDGPHKNEVGEKIKPGHLCTKQKNQHKTSNKVSDNNSHQCGRSSNRFHLEARNAVIDMSSKKHSYGYSKNIMDKFSFDKKKNTLAPNVKRHIKTKHDARVIVLVKPKFQPSDNGPNFKNTSIFSLKSDCRCKQKTCTSKYMSKCFLNSKATECKMFDAVNDFIKDLSGSNSTAKNIYKPEIELMAIEAFNKRITANSKVSEYKNSNATIDEVEVADEMFEATNKVKSNNNNFSDYVISLIDEVIKRNIPDNSLKNVDNCIESLISAMLKAPQRYQNNSDVQDFNGNNNLRYHITNYSIFLMECQKHKQSLFVLIKKNERGECPYADKNN